MNYAAPWEILLLHKSDVHKEWDDLPKEYKEFCKNHLHAMSAHVENDLAIQMLCHVIKELVDRVEILERK